MDAGNGKLVADVRGEIDTGDDGVLVIQRIHVRYRLEAPEDKRQTVERVHGIYAEHCPVYRSIRDSIDVTTEVELVAG